MTEATHAAHATKIEDTMSDLAEAIEEVERSTEALNDDGLTAADRKEMTAELAEDNATLAAARIVTARILTETAAAILADATDAL